LQYTFFLKHTFEYSVLTYEKVWPDGKTAFPDFFKKETVDWWHKELEDFYSVKNISFDGIWIVSFLSFFLF